LENEVHKIEQDNARVADDYLESLKKRRVHLKDELVEMIHKTEKAL
jgi:hypothetical protein